jgi:tetratricopeptide (TPR) repeat protein
MRVQAHPEVEEALARIDALIATAPDDAALYLQRGELHARHNDLIAAHADYQRAAKIAPRLPGLDRARGALALAKGQPADALSHLDRALEAQADDAEALVLRTRAHIAVGNSASALRDINAGLALIAAPTPDLYLTRAELFKQPGDAIRSLDEGIERIGAVPSLVIRALVLEESAGRIDAAKARLDRPRGSPRSRRSPT